MDYLHHLADIFVCSRLFFCQTAAALGSGDDALSGQLLVDASTGRLTDRGCPAEYPAGTMTGRTKGLFHAALLAHQHPTGTSHVSWNQHGLTDRAVLRGNLAMVRWKGTSRTFAMDPELPAFAAQIMFFEFGDVVCYVVNQAHLELLRSPPKHGRKRLASLNHQELSIAPGEVRGSTHRP